mmetsp:Transcript_20141/g.57597  ORF Transcript_20141/g.57597 Transcript_20141/m.57597 type:complete len:290 (+) Transcript_20141:51-920(+)
MRIRAVHTLLLILIVCTGSRPSNAFEDHPSPVCRSLFIDADALYKLVKGRRKEPREDQTHHEQLAALNGILLPGGLRCHGALRFLLYDVKIGEGFNLQKDVFYRAALVVHRLNQHTWQRCGGGRSCHEMWVLVLPPWCHVVHWRAPTDDRPRLPWGAFFDMQVMRSVVPVMEWDEYIETANDGMLEVDTLLWGQWKGFFPDASFDKDQNRLQMQDFTKCEGGGRSVNYRHHCADGESSCSHPHQATQANVTSSTRATRGVICTLTGRPLRTWQRRSLRSRHSQRRVAYS